MQILVGFFIFWWGFLSPIPGVTTQSDNPVIDSPSPGDVLQGVVKISGTTDFNGFLSTDVSFSYSDDPTGTWFLIFSNTQSVVANTIGTWDTTIITDGDYILRVRVFLSNGSFRETQVSGLRIRNYTPVETPTPISVAPEATPMPTNTPTALPFPTPTILPHNPATLALSDVSSSIFYGGIAAIIILFFIGFYLWLRRK